MPRRMRSPPRSRIVSAIPASAAPRGNSEAKTAANTSPNSGVVASSGLVRAAPIRAWLKLSVVQPTKKCTRPASAKAASPQAETSASSLTSSVATAAIARISAATSSCRKVEA